MVHEILERKFQNRKWQAKSRLCQDGSIAVTCQDDLTVGQVENFLNAIISDEFNSLLEEVTQ